MKEHEIMNRLETLEKLAKENNILRMGNSDGDLTVDEAIDFIERYESVIEKSGFPKDKYDLLD